MHFPQVQVGRGFGIATSIPGSRRAAGGLMERYSVFIYPLRLPTAGTGVHSRRYTVDTGPYPVVVLAERGRVPVGARAGADGPVVWIADDAG